jgi:DNA-binding NtrC family response regulator
MRRPSEWQHEFGPASSPVIIAGSSEPTSRLVQAIRALWQPDSAKCVIVEGGDGCGKSLAAAAFHAACQESEIAAVLVNEGSEPGSVMPRLKDADALIVDDLDLLSRRAAEGVV